MKTTMTDDAPKARRRTNGPTGPLIEARSIYNDPDTWARVDKLADKHIRDPSQMTRVLILKGLETMEKVKG